jgi:ATP:ADP antiporter, AAA family
VTLRLEAIALRGLDRAQRIKAALLGAWFFVTVATLWLLKPVRVASLLAHLGAEETPYVRLAGLVTLAVVVMLYSLLVGRLSRIGVVRTANGVFGALLVAFWLAMKFGGDALTAQRPFVWAVYILVEIYAVTLIGVFWTYANDVVTSSEANRLYGLVGLGGILGGIAGGAFVDVFAETIGPLNLLAISAGLVVVAMVLASVTEAVLRPPPRPIATTPTSLPTTWQGAIEVKNSPYLMLIVLVVIAYEFTATLTDFGVSVVFEHTYSDEAELAKMYGRLGWVVSATAIIGQLVIVPLLLPRKRIALVVPPLVMLAGAVGVVALPVIATAFVLAAADRGLNYSVHQVTKESLYVPLSDNQKYQAKAFIDMFVDRAAKATAAFVLIAVIATWGASVRATVLIGLGSIAVWFIAARRLGRFWKRTSDSEARLRGTPEQSFAG